MAAHQYRGLDGVNMIVPGSSLAASLWHGKRTQHLRQAMESDGMTIDELEGLWGDLAPGGKAEAFVDKPVRMLISTNDEVIPSVQQFAMYDRLMEAGAVVQTEYTAVGHYMAVGQACLARRI